MSNINLTYSSEMMTNYLHAEIISPQAKFEALQTNDGHSLLFSIGTDRAFYLIREESGTSTTGWNKVDLSSALIQKAFAGQPEAYCRTFEVGQSVQDGSIGMAMVVSTSIGDHLYLCLGNSNKDTTWADAPNWIAYEYDNAQAKLPKLEIVNVFFCETTGATQYIIVDVIRDSNSAVKTVRRFYIDPSKKTGRYWNSRDLPIDLEIDKYDSCLGRARKGRVDGLYTAGRAGSSGQLEFCPVINVYGSAPPTPARLNLPGGTIANAITATRNADLSTDLFVMSGKTLYYFSSYNQADGAIGVPLITHEVLSNTSKLVAMSHDGVITLWGKNASNQVYYLTCAQAEAANPIAWSVPLPILSSIEQISPYINGVDGGNTIFAAGDGKLQKITQSPTSTLWQAQAITLPPPPQGKSISFNSYTTTLQITDSQNLPLKDISLSLSASSRCVVYINGLYYVIDNAPIHVKSNAMGMVTIVESTETLTGTTFTVSTGSGAAIVINPMETPFKKLAALNTPEKLKAAQVRDAKGNMTSLVASNTDADQLQTVATALTSLSKSYDQANTELAPVPTTAMASFAPVAPVAIPMASMNLKDAIVVAAGDLFNWLKSGVNAIVKVVEDAATKAWHFIVQIGEKIYRAVLDTVEAVVGAVEWVFQAIKTAISEVIKYVSFLFEWEDIRRTKDVLHNLVKCYLQHQVDNLQVMKQDFDEMIGGVEDKINQWAGIQDWAGIGSDIAHKPATSQAANPMQNQTAASLHLSHHFQNNAQNVSITGKVPEVSLVQSLIDDLLTALKQEGRVLDGVIDQLSKLAQDFASLSVEDILKRLAGILLDGVLSSTQVVVDAIFNILTDLAQSAIDFLDTKIHIPVISDILNEIGIPDMSFLDVFCWIASVAYTVVYKLAKGEAPFPDNEYTTFLKNASSLRQLQQGFTTSTPRAMAMAAGPVRSSSLISLPTIPKSVQTAIFIMGHAMAGFFVFNANFVDSFEAAAETGANPFSTFSGVLGVLSGGSVGFANFLVPKFAIEETAISIMGTVTTGLRLLCKGIFSSPIQGKFAASEGIMQNLAAADGRATGAIVDAILIIPAIACTGWHFYELAQKSAGSDRSDAIIEEVSNCTSFISRVSYTIAVNDPEPLSKAIGIGVMVGANVAYSGLQTAQAAIG
ncbi:hypothetical protein [Alkalinema sp. FACHB-956]|uniref:hypothetical protein n=1 Tax=Alkalinema sp. FACHB-956 TaxID=2692768 RepID=UPI0016832874|nr:hypothetical protein [Alkalinema sp. FACHB-956]MBD2329772.1 hypothetical protein [Alkalinema sp. FACHB-956]